MYPTFDHLQANGGDNYAENAQKEAPSAWWYLRVY
jgi:hypothetical protein